MANPPPSSSSRPSLHLTGTLVAVTKEAGALKATYAWVSPSKCSSGRGAWKVFWLMQRRYHGLRGRLASESFPLGALAEVIQAIRSTDVISEEASGTDFDHEKSNSKTWLILTFVFISSIFALDWNTCNEGGRCAEGNLSSGVSKCSSERMAWKDF